MTETSPDDFSWMDASPPPVRPPRKKPNKAKAKRNNLKPAKRQTLEPKVESAKTIDHDAIRGNAMFTTVNGRKRIWACDGEFVFFRRKLAEKTRTENGEKHNSILRHQRFLDRGDFTYVGTYDDVEVCKVNETSPLYRKGVYLGQLSEGALNRAAAIAAVARDWVLYADVLEQLAVVVKSKWQTPGQQTTCWNEHLTYIDQLVAMRGGPSPMERGQALAQIRQARGDGKGRVILLGR